MWRTIENFRENLSQIASDVLDTAEELEIAGSKHGGPDGLDHLLQRRRLQDSDFEAEENRFKIGLRRLQRVESSMTTNHVLLLKEKEDELLRLREENDILKKKLLTNAAERSALSNGDLKNHPGFEGSSEGHLDALHERDGNENDASKVYNDTLSNAKDMGAHNQRLQAMERQDLSRKISDNNLAYASLKDAHAQSLDEIRNLKEVLEKEREDLANAQLQLQREWKAIEAANKESKQLRGEKQKVSLEVVELQQRLNEKMAEQNSAKDHLKAEILKEMEPDLSLKSEKIEKMQILLEDLERENRQLQAEVKRLSGGQGQNQHTLVREGAHVSVVVDGQLVEAKDSFKQSNNIPKDAEEAIKLEQKNYEKSLHTVRAERDKALRDLKRLKQHLIEKEQADSEKMDQDSERIETLQQRADASTLRALQLEQTLEQTLANQREVNRKNSERLEEANEEISHLRKRLAGCIAALESKDVELLNLQTVLGQYYAESEAKDRLHGELAAAKKELSLLSEKLKAANIVIEVKTKEKEEVLRQLASQQKSVLESQEKACKLEADILMLRRALEQSLTRLNRMSSDSDYYVDRRIVIKLLVTYFQRHQSKEVLDLMARMLGFSEEDKNAIGFAQRGVVRGVLGLPGRVVGGIFKSGLSPSALPSLSQTDNQSFADLWIDFLLKESEERERREAILVEAKAGSDKQSISSLSAQRIQESASTPYGKGTDASSRSNFTTELAVSANRPTSVPEHDDPDALEFSTVPLTSASAPLVHGFLHSRTSRS